MIILDEVIPLNKLSSLESVRFFPDMVKAVVDIKECKIALCAELHSDLEQLMLESGYDQKNLYGINIYYSDGMVEFDSAINPPRNRDAGFPRVGRYVADPAARERIMEVVAKWIAF